YLKSESKNELATYGTRVISQYSMSELGELRRNISDNLSRIANCLDCLLTHLYNVPIRLVVNRRRKSHYTSITDFLHRRVVHRSLRIFSSCVRLAIFTNQTSSKNQTYG